MDSYDVVIVGGGHNALVAATVLARAGRDTVVVERLDHVGGAAVSHAVFPGHDARLSRYSYLVGLFPEPLVDELGLDLELRSRPGASYTPYLDAAGRAGGLVIETVEAEATRASFRRLTGDDAEYAAWRRFGDELGNLAAVVAPSLLEPIPRAADLRRRVPAPIWADVVEHPLGTAIERRFADDLVRGVVGTDALIGTFASLHDPSLVQNRCFLYHVIGNGTGEWRVPVGGMGAVSDALRRAASAAGVSIVTGTPVTALEPDADGVTVRGPRTALRAGHVLAGVAPPVLAALLGEDPAPVPSGSQFKVNLLLSRLPRLRSGDAPETAFAGTFHVGERMSELEELYTAAREGRAPFAAGELYCHTLTDRSILGPELAASGAHTLTWFGLHTPAENLPDAAAGEEAYRRVVAAIEEHLAEPLEPLILGVEHRTPRQIETDLAMPGGHIFHGDLSWPWHDDDTAILSAAQRWGVETSHPRILRCGSSARRGGAVSGLGGRDAAQALLT